MIVEFDISLAVVQNPRFVESCPPGRFDTPEVLEAVSKWKYDPPSAPKRVRSKLYVQAAAVDANESHLASAFRR